jgi:Ca2+-transporting ATPase
MEMKEYLEKSSKILDELQTTEQGLSEAEAARRLSEHGPNRLAAGKRRVICSGFSKS